MVIEVTFDVTDVYISTTVSPVYVNVSFEAPSGGGGAVWGDITGTLSDQTDLQTALDGKFDDPTGTSLQYIDGTGALQTFPLTLPVLQQVRNQTGGTLAVGTVVYISGATGNLPTVTKAIATGDATSAQTLGMISASIANNGVGYVVVIGTCSGLDTSAYTEGQQLYLSYTTAGAVTTTKPYAPNHLVYVGIVTRAHPTLGTVEVRVQNGYELDEIHDVDALNPNNNDGIFYNSTTALWEHKQISTALGYTPANSATTLTINGVTYDLSANRSWTISAGISGSGASGQVAYWDGTTSQAGSNNLFWDNANGRLGIMTNTPAYTVDVSGTMRGTGIYYNTGYNISVQRLGFNNGTVGGNFGYIVGSSNGVFRLVNSAESDFTRLQFGGTTSSFPALQRVSNALAVVDGTGSGTSNLLVGSTTDSGQRLQVQGTTLLNGNVTFSSATGMTWDAANGRLGIGTNSPAQILDIRGTGVVVNKVTSSTNTGSALFQAQNNINSLYEFGVFGSTRSAFGAILSNNAYLYGSVDLAITSVGVIKFGTGITADERVRIFTTGNVLIQNGGTFTDTGERLQVTGNVKVVGSGNTSATFGLVIQNSVLANIFRVRNDGEAFGVNFTASTGFTSTRSFASSGGVANAFWALNSFGPTSGTAEWNSINIQLTLTQGGTATGISRGLYVNPTITSAFDFRAIETTNGKVIFGNLPTSSAGLPTGAIWNDAGTIKIV